MQTLLGLCALVSVGFLSYGLQQSRHQAGEEMIKTEVEALALAAAEDQLDAAARLPFDAANGATVATQLTASTAFGTAAGTLAAARDLDDLHGARGTVRVAAAQGGLDLTLTTAVRYVRKQGDFYSASPVQTFIKELTVTAQGAGQAVVTLTRLYPHTHGL